jgi:hypothetical protein
MASRGWLLPAVAAGRALRHLGRWQSNPVPAGRAAPPGPVYEGELAQLSIAWKDRPGDRPLDQQIRTLDYGPWVAPDPDPRPIASAAASSSVPAILQAGERVVPLGGADGGITVINHIYGITDPNALATADALAPIIAIAVAVGGALFVLNKLGVLVPLVSAGTIGLVIRSADRYDPTDVLLVLSV